MNLELTYPELAFLREVLRKRRWDVWVEIWCPQLKNFTTDEIMEINKSYQNDYICFQGWVTRMGERSGKDLIPWLGNTDGILTFNLLKKIDSIESQIKEEIEA